MTARVHVPAASRDPRGTDRERGAVPAGPARDLHETTRTLTPRRRAPMRRAGTRRVTVDAALARRTAPLARRATGAAAPDPGAHARDNALADRPRPQRHGRRRPRDG